jgi:ElaB/YqjD/DUF883 family membrane-anchored ribosome-binding protein
MENQIPITSMDQEQPEAKPAPPHEIPEQIREISDKVARTFREFRESDTYDRIIEGKETASDYIRNNPLASFGYALGAGIFLGFILKKSR